MIPVSSCALLLVASLCAGQAAGAGFDGQPPLRADDERRHLFRPYSAVQLDYLGANYCENLLDSRLNITSYTHQGFDSNRSDAWHLQFPDDAARIVEALVWEDQYSGVARLESVRRIVKGILAAQVPGTRGYHFFRHRSAGKTFVIFDDSAEKKEGRLRVSMWGDEVQGDVSVGFRAQFDGAWLEQKDFTYADTPDQAATPAVARSPQYWNESPFVFTRAFSRPNQAVTFSGRYGLSDDDTPLEFSYESSQAEKLAITVGEPGKPIPVLTDAKTPGFIDYPDRKTHWRSDKDGDQSILAPNFNYFVLHKPATWACPGYSSALLVMWDGRPEAIELLAENGYGHVRVVYAATGAGVKGRVRLYPFHWVNQDDTEHVFRCADSFLATGRMIQNGFPSQQIVNAIPSGLAAGAYLLTKYKDPFARTAQLEALNAVDCYLDPENQGHTFARSFLEVKAAAWTTLLARQMGDAALKSNYAAWVKRLADRMLSKDAGYDGAAWGDGWTHFNCMKAVWMAYEATGAASYREAYERAMGVYTIDEKGVYRNGVALAAPGGFDVYAGALPMAVWGHWGLKDRVERLLTLQAPNGWHNPTLPVADLWNDAGAGPWSQDDANPDMLGFMLRGYAIPTEPKRLVPTGAFPKFTGAGAFEATWTPIVDNPFFRPGDRQLRELSKGEGITSLDGAVTELDLSGQRQSPPQVQAHADTKGIAGAALDIRAVRGAYRIDASPDGSRWFSRLDTWCDTPVTRSVDLSFLTGGADELVPAAQIEPPADATWLVSSTGTELLREHSRAIAPDGAVVYRVELPYIDLCRIEFLVANNYRIDLSGDGADWREALTPDQITPAKSDPQTNASWLRMVDATAYARPNGCVFVRVRNGGADPRFSGEPALLRRTTVYASFKAPEIHLRITPAPYAVTQSFALEWARLRTW